MAKRLLIIKGDCSGAFGAIEVYWWLFKWRRRREHQSFEVRVLVMPPVARLEAALLEADAAVFYGHGKPGRVLLGQSDLDTDAVRRVGAARKQPMEFVQIACCDTCRDPDWVAAWLTAAKVVRGYEGLTYDVLRPWSIPEQRTYLRSS